MDQLSVAIIKVIKNLLIKITEPNSFMIEHKNILSARRR